MQSGRTYNPPTSRALLDASQRIFEDAETALRLESGHVQGVAGLSEGVAVRASANISSQALHGISHV